MHFHVFSLQWILGCLLLFFATDVQAEEKLFCPFDDRRWKIGFEEHTKEQAITEMILEQEEITNWNELFTVQLFEGLEISAADFVSELEKASKKNLPAQETLRFKILEPNPLNIFESSFIFNRDKKNSLSTIANNEYNMGRVLKSKKTTYYIRYSTKDENVFKQNQEVWVKRFKQAYVASEPRSNPQGRWLVFTAQGVYEQDRLLSYQPDDQFIENKEVGYTLSLPKEWKVEKPSSLSSTSSPSRLTESVHFSSPDKRIQGSLAFLDLPEGTSSIDYLELYKQQHPQAKLIEQGKIQTVVGQEETYFIFVEGNEQTWVTFMNMDQRIYSLALSTQRENFNKVKKELENILSNFQVASAVSPMER